MILTRADLAHIHLLLNHVPTVGTVIGLGLLLLSLVRKNHDLIKVSLEVFVLIALATLPTYMSGAAASQAIGSQSDISIAWMNAHQNAALWAFIWMAITGAIAWFGLWQYRRTSRPPHRTVGTVLLLSVVTMAVMARTANIGGEIRHPEIRDFQETAVTQPESGSGSVTTQAVLFAPLALRAMAQVREVPSTEEPSTTLELMRGAGITRTIGSFVVGRRWVWPTCQTLHLLGMTLLFGVLLLVNLRMLGVITNQPFAALHRLLPWGIMGFGVNIVTGMLFFIGAPQQYILNPPYHWKMLLIMLAGANFLYLTVADDCWALARENSPPLKVKAIAASSIFLWAGVMYCGRMLPFLGNSF